VTGVPDFNESTYKKVNDTTVEFVRLKDGKEVQRGTRVVSTDGKTLTFTIKGVNASGQQIDNAAVYEKQ
jgi:VCBS repeat-containing protein